MEPKPIEFQVHLGNGLTENLLLMPLGSDHYRVEVSSLTDDSINLGDVIEAEAIASNEIRFVRMAENSPLVTLRWLIPQKVAESEGLTKFLEKVIEVGGLWERAFGGYLLLHLPRAEHFDAETEFKLYTSEANPS